MSQHQRLAFIGGGNMASAIMGGLVREGMSAGEIAVIEPSAPARAKLLADFGITAQAQPGDFLTGVGLVVWAVKPQTFKDAALAVRPYVTGALHLSVAAGIGSDSIAAWLGNERVIRAMPNTPALIGKGITGLYARSAVADSDRAWAASVLGTTGALVWLTAEEQLDAVTAISGSGPAYMFYFMEAMTDAGVQMGLPREQAYQFAVATFIGAGELARSSSEPPSVLRERVTSKGGTTHAAISVMESHRIKELFAQALFAAQQRAAELGREFGA